MKDFYHLLGVTGDASPGEIDEAYRKLAAKFQSHAGVTDHFLENYFKEITEAHEILSDPLKRTRYDAEMKKAMQTPLSYFSTKPLNIAVTVLLICVAFLFGWYVIRTVLRLKPSTLIKTTILPAANTKHHKIHHATGATVVNTPLAAPNTQMKPLKVKADTHGTPSGG